MALVLIVVDEPATLLTLRRDLEQAGYETVLAADADTALALLAGMPIDVVALDVVMPVRDGWLVLDAARDRPDPVPVIVVSRHAGPFDLQRARRRGAFGSLAAPFRPQELLDVVSDALAESQGDSSRA